MWDRYMSYHNAVRLISLISATHGHVPADEQFDADSLFVVVKNNLKRATHTVDNVLLGQKHPENSEEKLSTDSFDTQLCRLGLDQLSSEMVCEALRAEIAHETTMSIFNKLSGYSWDAKAVLILTAFALNYKYLLADAQLHSSHQVSASVEIPKHVLDLQKYKKKIREVNKMINDTLDVTESIFELQKLSTNNYIKDKPDSYVVGRISLGVYWIIITVVACTTQMRCLTNDKDKTVDLLGLARAISDILSNLKDCISSVQFRIEKKKAERKLKELLQTPDEIMEVFKGLIFARNDMQSLIDGSTNEMVTSAKHANFF